MPMTSNLSRRYILRSGSALIISFALRRASATDDTEARFAGKPVDGTEVDSFLAIHPKLPRRTARLLCAIGLYHSVLVSEKSKNQLLELDIDLRRWLEENQD